MILISHRGNLNGKDIENENHPKKIEQVLSLGFDVEIDIWMVENKLYLGHDNPIFEVSLEWLKSNGNKLWIHCKNLKSLDFFTEKKLNLNFFWHQNDKFTLTSKGYIWCYPSESTEKNTICVLPELNNIKNFDCIGVCSDYIQNFIK